MKLLLLLLLCSSSAARFVVNVSQSSYQAEEQQDISLEWSFTSRADSSWTQLFIYCSLLAPVREAVLYQLHEGLELSEAQDQQFAGRVQTDKDVLREGRLTLHLSKLTTEDSGLYQCEVKTEDGVGFKTCQLNVSAAADQLQTHTPTWTPAPEERSKKYVYLVFLVPGASVLYLIFILLVITCKKIPLLIGTERNNFSENEPLQQTLVCH